MIVSQLKKSKFTPLSTKTYQQENANIYENLLRSSLLEMINLIGFERNIDDNRV